MTGRIAGQIDIPDAQPRHLSDAQSQPIEHGEDDPIGMASAHGAAGVRQLAGGFEQSTSGGVVEEKRQTRLGRSSGSSPHGRGSELVVRREPVEQPDECPAQVVVTTRRVSGARDEEGVHDVGRDRTEYRDRLRDQKSIEQPQGQLLDTEEAAERAFVGQKRINPRCQRAVETGPGGFHLTSSLSPYATSRRASTATLL